MWNYRVVRKKQTWIDPDDAKENIDYTYAIHEAYNDSNGYVGHITEDARVWPLKRSTREETDNG